MDGTFKSSSYSFFQVYILHGDFNGQCFPLLYCFLSSKTEETYVNVFNLIKTSLAAHSINFSPSVVQIDFKAAAYNAIRRCFPDAKIIGCYFHFGQAIWRRLQNLGLVTLYNTNSNFANIVEIISALALIPIEDIDNAWNIIKSMHNFENNINVLELFNFLEEIGCVIQDLFLVGKYGPITEL